MKLAVSLCLILCLTQLSEAQIVAFPSAQGYGKYATGGRDGIVVAVTNLDDYDPKKEKPVEGSFRWAFTQGKDSVRNDVGKWEYYFKPLTVVFKVGGVISLKSEFALRRNNVTIAGQTALGEGICFKGYTLTFNGCHNLIVRYLRSRPGDETGAQTSAFRLENGSNFIFDHCSMSWSVEETTHYSSAHDFTIQWCIISEALYSSGHKKGDRGYGMQWGGQYATYHHNLIAHNQSRSPRFNGSNKNDLYALIDFRNNVVFNWGNNAACYGGEWERTDGKGYSHINFVNNYYKPGPATSPNPEDWYFASPDLNRKGVSLSGYAKWFFSGNVMVGHKEKTTDNWLGVETKKVGSKENIYSAGRFVQTNGKLEAHDSYTETATEAYHSISKNAGAIYPKRDAIDARVIGELTGEIAISRMEYHFSDSVLSPKRGISTGIIDTPQNLRPANAPFDWNPWASYYATIGSDKAPLDSDNDGIPDKWELANGLNPKDSTDYNRLTKSGYTALEVYLFDLVGENIPLDI